VTPEGSASRPPPIHSSPPLPDLARHESETSALGLAADLYIPKSCPPDAETRVVRHRVFIQTPAHRAENLDVRSRESACCRNRRSSPGQRANLRRIIALLLLRVLSASILRCHARNQFGRGAGTRWIVQRCRPMVPWRVRSAGCRGGLISPDGACRKCNRWMRPSALGVKGLPLKSSLPYDARQRCAASTAEPIA